jgi:DNA-binding LytR/AlgR family response regulator
VHQGYIVNFAKVKDFDNYSVILKANEKVPISIRKKKEVLLAYARYVESSL